ncbi:MAG: HAD family hydrolase [Methylobacteriaceae bacterium]|nr:HAD family hydrolase [Methylobacteriaceae bacterium]
MSRAFSVLLDLDGTLTDPKPGITESVRHALRRLNETRGLSLAIPSQDELEWTIGPPLIDSFRLIAGREHGEAGVAFYRERYADVGLFENRVYDGIPAALTALRAQGFRLFVATSKPRVFAERIVAHFGLARFFDRVHGSGLDGTNIHKPELLRHILAVEAIDPARAVMIGDRKHDAIGAKANHVAALGVAWGYGSRAELTDAGVATILETPDELPAAVARCAGG